ncbi:unnamed protein product [Darwinula stevensoni]|uniref:Uncharacterized protein n=1 Tax=Darwinula stevensoni TaxID=69355 RepID=A0A7R9AAM4_9CRUS|nr:unnamed protein product [Darwinula stevensoni]CAG0898600.1 unnamed protein product [Darwinula stevensoni]
MKRRGRFPRHHRIACRSHRLESGQVGSTSIVLPKGRFRTKGSFQLEYEPAKVAVTTTKKKDGEAAKKNDEIPRREGTQRPKKTEEKKEAGYGSKETDSRPRRDGKKFFLFGQDLVAEDSNPVPYRLQREENKIVLVDKDSADGEKKRIPVKLEYLTVPLYPPPLWNRYVVDAYSWFYVKDPNSRHLSSPPFRVSRPFLRQSSSRRPSSPPHRVTTPSFRVTTPSPRVSSPSFLVTTPSPLVSSAPQPMELDHSGWTPIP